MRPVANPEGGARGQASLLLCFFSLSLIFSLNFLSGSAPDQGVCDPQFKHQQEEYKKKY